MKEHLSCTFQLHLKPFDYPLFPLSFPCLVHFITTRSTEDGNKYDITFTYYYKYWNSPRINEISGGVLEVCIDTAEITEI